MIRLVIVDDYAVVRSGLAELLAGVPGMLVVGVAADGLTAVTLINQQRPDVVLMDLSMPNVDGVEATRLVVASRPETRVVILTAFSGQKRIFDALDAGAVGYLLKDATPEELVRGVTAAAAGESPFSPKAASALVARQSEQRRADKRRSDGLTAREREVLMLVGQGMANKAIARRLGISEKTVKTHLTTVFARIGAQPDRKKAVLWALRHGIGEQSRD